MKDGRSETALNRSLFKESAGDSTYPGPANGPAGPGRPPDSHMILSLCDRTGVMVRPWAEAGYDCLCVDIQHQDRIEGSIAFVGADVTDYLPPLTEYRMVFAFPPCTNLAVSGARWFRDKGLKGLCDGLRVVEACRRICEWSGAPYLIENPVSTLSTYWRKPDHIFDPCDYGGYLTPPGDRYTKRTCLWTGNGFVMPAKRPVEPAEKSLIHHMPPSPDRGDLRSVTPEGFARAVFEANHSQAEAA